MEKGKLLKGEPRFAPGLELDNLKEKAAPEEIERGDSTSVTSLILDRTGDGRDI